MSDARQPLPGLDPPSYAKGMRDAARKLLIYAAEADPDGRTHRVVEVRRNSEDTAVTPGQLAANWPKAKALIDGLNAENDSLRQQLADARERAAALRAQLDAKSQANAADDAAADEIRQLVEANEMAGGGGTATAAAPPLVTRPLPAQTPTPTAAKTPGDAITFTLRK